MSNNLSRRQIAGLTGGFVFANIITSLIANGRAQAQPSGTFFNNLFVSGSVGIGTTSPGTPSWPLAIRGRGVGEELISFESPNGTTKWHINQNLGGNNPGLNFVETGVADGRLFIRPGGNIGIGTVKPSEKLEVVGNVKAYYFITASSRELKENVAELSSSEAFETLENLNPLKFNYKADSDKNLHLGFIAEDVPSLVATSGRKGVSSMDIVTLLTKVVKEQQTTIATLVEKVKILEARST
ncbi:tail fiber domain-containing protein [Nostoc sphaeroides CHAB 2801]|uniref:tail fiber domain-containing protein n=1 Tax=Nostoc sphaeroides TaxID=446679 RepID=UPI000E476D13|nr:tail fiber domain-containing protein [Nostoc sphaeroides]MCC5629902.1 tail fiber domain-containing protein [Nostoc sphaeroides CHAB 2801]